jgi:hypothetical protein
MNGMGTLNTMDDVGESGRMYEELCQIISDVENGTIMLETIILNEKDERTIGYLNGALTEMRRVLSYLSDAEFEMSTTPIYD